MAKFFFAVALLNGLFWLSHSKANKPGDYYTFFHVATKRYLSIFGKATTFSPYNSEKFEIYPAGDNKSYLLSEPWLEKGNPERTMEITYGCRLNGKVRDYEFNKGTNQQWILHEDDDDVVVISSACNPNWIIVTDNYGAQTVQDKDSVPAAKRVWQKRFKGNPQKLYNA